MQKASHESKFKCDLPQFINEKMLRLEAGGDLLSRPAPPPKTSLLHQQHQQLWLPNCHIQGTSSPNPGALRGHDASHFCHDGNSDLLPLKRLCIYFIDVDAG